MKRLTTLLLLTLSAPLWLLAQVPFGQGTLTVKRVARNAVRIQYAEGEVRDTLPDWLYVRHDEVKRQDIKVNVDQRRQTVTISDRRGRTVFTASHHDMQGRQATLAFRSPQD